MTIRELRRVLTEIGDQDMTVRQVRTALFAQPDQDVDLPGSLLFGMTAPVMCEAHPAFEASYCPSCGTARKIGG